MNNKVNLNVNEAIEDEVRELVSSEIISKGNCVGTCTTNLIPLLEEIANSTNKIFELSGTHTETLDPQGSYSWRIS